ncbi:MAG TPA: hypothetical protein VH158_07335 [Gemmatimonadales bacterium]|nr:hypothetical protein [Gemmatimonadales bacterium]
MRRDPRPRPQALWLAQTALALALACGAAFLTAHGASPMLALGVGGAVLVASGVLLVVWTDDDRGGKPAA